MKRLFIGVPVSEAVKGKVNPLLDELKEFNLNLVSLENLHFTVKYLGNVTDEQIDEVKDKLAKVVADKNSFEINLTKVGVFQNLEKIRVIWIDVEDSSEFVSLMKEVNIELNYIKENDHQEVPHLTIARVKNVRDKDKLLDFLEKRKEFGLMVVNKLVLYESELTPEGPVYTVVEEFGLK